MKKQTLKYFQNSKAAWIFITTDAIANNKINFREFM